MSTRQDFHAALYELAQLPEAAPAIARMAALFERVRDLAADGHHDQAAAELADYRGLLLLGSALPSWQWPAVNPETEER